MHKWNARWLRMHAHTIQYSTVQYSAVQYSMWYASWCNLYQLFVTCTNYTAWKWRPEKKNHDLAPELAAYTLTRSFSHTSHQCSHDSIIVYAVMGGPQFYDHVDMHLKNLCDGVLSGQLACACAWAHESGVDDGAPFLSLYVERGVEWFAETLR